MLTLLTFSLSPEPMHGPRRLEVVDIQSRQVTIHWEPLGYNVTRCHSYNLTVQYRSRVAGKEETREEVCYEAQSRDPQHTIHNLSPFTNLSVKLISYKAVSSFDPELDLSNQSGKAVKLGNETTHMFMGLYPGSTYSFTLRASTAKGYGPPVITQFTTKISAPSMPAYDQDTSLNQTDSTVTVLLKPAQSRGAPVSHLLTLSCILLFQESATSTVQINARAPDVEAQAIPIHFQNATVLNSQYYFTAQFPAAGIHSPQPFTVGDNKTYNGYWNAPLLPQKSYSVYYQAVSTANGVAAILVTQLTTPYIRIAPAAGDNQLTGQA
ncbi:hypothetical protein GOODEAATRI_000026 [Goodea atripinnis]|uniref:Fibronectin type-III domain-containing protein n=1 Tax=Goodea atripinnis TaxID=208336 RepID=A0ABV0PU44_9TELE